jgi:hypothetical protein
MLEFTNDEIVMLVEDGYEPGFMMDIREGDLVAIPPIMRTNFEGVPNPVRTLVIQRIMPVDSSYHDMDTDELVRNVVIHFIGMTLENLPQHCTYGSTYPCFFKRPQEA